MDAKKLLFFQFSILAIIGFLYFLGLWLYLYWVFWWYDIALHLLGGVWAAVFATWLFALYDREPLGSRILAITIVIGVLWEIFEFLVGMPREANYWLDTSLDLFMDVIGGAAGVVLAMYVQRGGSEKAMIE